jgi:hypothetical protein
MAGPHWPDPLRADGAALAEILAPCRESFPQVVGNPNAEGGWSVSGAGAETVLCIYGSFPASQVAGARAALPVDGALTVAVRSTGGPAASWLSLAEHLEGRKVTLVIDEACFSSCANYLPIVAGQVLALENSLLLWHGGPGEAAAGEIPIVVAGVAEFLAYDNLARRTRALYRRNKVAIALLTASARPTAPGTWKTLGLAVDPPPEVAGYAFSPDTLLSCFNLQSTAGMWHAGSDADVMRLAQARSGSLFVLESPKKPGGLRDCEPVPRTKNPVTAPAVP